MPPENHDKLLHRTRLLPYIFLAYQGVKFRNASEPVLYLEDPDGLPREMRRKLLDGIGKLNGLKARQSGDPEIEARTKQFEMAYRMQTSIPELADLSDEPQHVLDMYGED